MDIFIAENIYKSYAGHQALNDVSINVPENSIYGLLGPNGAGKTSLIRIINQITAPDSGTILLNGKPLQRADISLIGYLPEERGLYKKMQVGEQALYLAQLKGMDKHLAKQKLEEWFEKFEITNWWNKKVEELSKGMAQKIQFITTVLHEPKLLILDEPFSGFDPINTNLIKAEILRMKEEGTSIILSTHNMGSVEEICDNIALINQSKKILEGKVSEIKDQFKSQTYTLHFTGNMIAFTNALWTGFELLERKSQSQTNHTAVVRLLNNNSLNDLLKTIINEVQITSVQEIVPTMNDIFIDLINKNDNE